VIVRDRSPPPPGRHVGWWVGLHFGARGVASRAATVRRPRAAGARERPLGRTGGIALERRVGNSPAAERPVIAAAAEPHPTGGMEPAGRGRGGQRSSAGWAAGGANRRPEQSRAEQSVRRESHAVWTEMRSSTRVEEWAEEERERERERWREGGEHELQWTLSGLSRTQLREGNI